MFGFQQKKKTAKAWQPDFRLTDRLPDTKVVRTKFMVNFVAIALLLLLAVFTGYREFSKINISSSISSIKNDIETRTSANRKFAAMSGEFKKLVSNVNDISEFKKQPINPNVLLLELSRMRTPDVVFDQIAYKNFWNSGLKKEIFSVRIVGKGRTTADIGELKSRLAIFDIPNGYEVSVSEEGNPTKDAVSGVFSFVILLTITEVKNGGK